MFPSIKVTMKFGKSQRYAYARKPITRITQRAFVLDIGHKPTGFWYDIGGEWADWLKYEQPDWAQTSYRIAHAVVVDEARILRIRTHKQLLDFAAEYRVKHGDVTSERAATMGPIDRYIDWRRVERNGYAGVEIAPYIGSARFDDLVPWYYGWDIASGCIWDFDAIIRVTPVGEWFVGVEDRWA